MTQKYSKYSVRGQPVNQRVDIAALSQRAGDYRVALAAPAFTQNATTRGQQFVVPFPMTLRSAQMAYDVLPIGGTLTVGIVAYDASADAEIVLCDTMNPEVAAMTAREGKAFALATTNVALDTGDTVCIVHTADNNAVSTAQVGGGATLLFTPVDQTVLDY